MEIHWEGLPGEQRHPPKKFLNAWIHAPKKPGRPQVTCHENFINSLRRILPNEVDEEGGFKGWTKYAKNKQIWDGIIEKFFKELKPSDDGSPKKSEKKKYPPKDTPGALTNCSTNP